MTTTLSVEEMDTIIRRLSSAPEDLTKQDLLRDAERLCTPEAQTILYRHPDLEERVRKMLIGYSFRFTSGTLFSGLHYGHDSRIDLELIHAYMDAGADINHIHRLGLTPTTTTPFMEIVYAYGTDYEMIQDLLHHGANPNAYNGELKTLLSIAMYCFDASLRPNRPLLSLLLQYGADPNFEITVATGYFHHSYEQDLLYHHLKGVGEEYDRQSIQLLLDYGANITDDAVEFTKKAKLDELTQLFQRYCVA